MRISTKVVDAANEQPVRDALVMILRPGVDAKKVDVNRLDDQVLSWGRTNTQGEVQLKQPVPVPGTYSVMIVARTPDVLARLQLPSHGWHEYEAPPGRGWTDDYINLPRALWEGLTGAEECRLYSYLPQCGNAETPATTTAPPTDPTQQ